LVAAEPSASVDVRAGNLRDDHIAFEYAIYFLPAYSGDAKKLLADEVRRIAPAVKLVEKLPNPPTSERVVSARIENDVGKTYTPLDRHALKYLGRGLSDEQGEKLQSSRQALVSISPTQARSAGRRCAPRMRSRKPLPRSRMD
jgi:hypothetical protein